MVAEDGEVVADFVHQVNDIFALGDGADDIALNGVAVVDEGDIRGQV